MKSLFILLGILTLIPNANCFAQNQPEPEITQAIYNLDEVISHSGAMETQKQEMTQGLQQTLDRLLAKLPEGSLKRGFKQYMEVLGLSTYSSAVGTANTGISSYFENKFRLHGCYGQMAKKFYDEIQNYDRAQLARQDFAYDFIPLSVVVGVAPYEETVPGWIWQRAMKSAGNDMTLALTLIATCGHDDVLQGNYSFIDQTPLNVERILTQIQSHRQELELKVRSQNQSSAEQTQIEKTLKYYEVAEQKIKKYGGVGSKVYCPIRISSMYLPQSLSKQADISEELKQKITDIQAAESGMSSLPSKYYHVYGAAFMTCQLIQNGVTPKIAELIQTQAARGYRGLRICENTNDYLIKRNQLEQIYVKGHLENESLHDFVASKAVMVQQAMKSRNKVEPSELVDIFSRMGLPIYDSSISEVKMRELAMDQMVNLDAAVLYRKWFLGAQTIAGLKIPCTDFGLVDPTRMIQKDEYKNLVAQKLVCEESWPEDMCNKARHRVAVWKNDFEWTIEQHRAGAKFASTHCRLLAPEEDLFQSACQAGTYAGKSEKNKRIPSGRKQ